MLQNTHHINAKSIYNHLKMTSKIVQVVIYIDCLEEMELHI